MDLQTILQEINHEITPLYGQGQVAQYIPALANIDPNQFAMAITTTDGQQFGVGNVERPFSIQSISKVFSYTLALDAYGDKLFNRVWREPSGDPFNSLVQLEYESGIPRNPFINAGAIVVTDSLLSQTDNNRPAWQLVRALVRQAADDSDIEVDTQVVSSELEHSYRNRALANLMKSFGNLSHDVDRVLDNYCHQCSIAMSPNQLSRAMLYLANLGTDPLTQRRFVTSSQAKRINSLMLTCGHYDASGDFAFRVGLPAKSGVGGGIVAVVPGRMAIAVYSPALNKQGNSLIGTEALELFTTKTGLSVF